MIDYNFITSMLNVGEDDIEDIDIQKKDDKVIIDLKLKDRHPRCPYCGGEVVFKEYRINKIHLTDMVSIMTIVNLKKRRYKCKYCHSTFSETSPLGPNNTNVSWLTIKKVLEDLKNPELTYKTIANMNHISPSRVQTYADSYLVVPRLTLPYSIGIDELHQPSLAKYGDYIAIIVDNVKRGLLDILPSRKKESLIRYFSGIPKEERANVKYVTIDLWETYRDIAHTYLPNAKVCADPFHLVKIITKAFDDYRKEIMNRFPRDSRSYYLFKNWFKLLLSNDYDFSQDKERKFNHKFSMYLNYYDLRKMLLDHDVILKEAYELKEDFRYFIKNTKEESAREDLDKIYKEFKDHDLPLYRDFLKTLKAWKEEIINSFDRPYNDRKQSNSLAEYLNERIGKVFLVANGVYNFERTRARLLYMFNNKVYYSLSSTFSSRKVKGRLRGKYKKRQIK